MTKLLTSLFLIGAIAEAKISNDLLETYKTFATRDLMMFGASKETKLNLSASAQGYFIESGGEYIGEAIPYERCLAKLSGEDVQLNCYDGVAGTADLCKIKPKPAICVSEGVKQKLREIYLDPSLEDGQTIRGLGKVSTNPHMQSLTAILKQHPAARKAMAQALMLNGCGAVEMGDVAGQTFYLDQQALSDEDTNEVFEGARNRYRMVLNCKTASASVYIDVVRVVEHGKIVLKLVPVKAVEAPAVEIETATPML